MTNFKVGDRVIARFNNETLVGVINSMTNNHVIIGQDLRWIPKIYLELTQPLFFMVYVEGANSPTIKHETYSSAKNEAERLQEKTGKRTYILQLKDTIFERKKSYDILNSFEKVLIYLYENNQKEYIKLCLRITNNPENCKLKLMEINKAWNKFDGFDISYKKNDKEHYSIAINQVKKGIECMPIKLSSACLGYNFKDYTTAEKFIELFKELILIAHD